MFVDCGYYCGLLILDLFIVVIVELLGLMVLYVDKDFDVIVVFIG